MRDSPSAEVRGLTTRGRCLLAGGLAATVCAVLLDERDLLRVGLLAVLLPLVAVLVTATRRLKLTADHQVLPERLRPGTVGHITLTLANDGTSRTRPLEISEAPTPDLTAGVRCLLPSLRRGRSAQASYRLYAIRRGRFELGPPRVRVSDPFGLWEEVRTLPATSEVLVVPAVVQLAGMPASAGARSAASTRAASNTIGGDPDVGIRAYRNGDDIRTIHWRASARHDDLMVRLDEPVSHGGAAVLLDHRVSAHRGTGAGSSLETAVTLAASVSLHLLSTDHEVRLLSHTGDVLAQGHDIADDVLAGLAVVEPDDGQLAPVAMGTAGLLIAVLGDQTAEETRLLIAAKPRHVRGVAMVVSAADFDQHRTAGPAATTLRTVQLLTTAGWRAVEVHAGDDLSASWRAACSSAGSYDAAAVRSTVGRRVS